MTMVDLRFLCCVFFVENFSQDGEKLRVFGVTSCLILKNQTCFKKKNYIEF
jgi:hypothetical protein